MWIDTRPVMKPLAPHECPFPEAAVRVVALSRATPLALPPRAQVRTQGNLRPSDLPRTLLALWLGHAGLGLQQWFTELCFCPSACDFCGPPTHPVVSFRSTYSARRAPASLHSSFVNEHGFLISNSNLFAVEKAPPATRYSVALLTASDRLGL
jgi:hypothetical protein